MNVTPDGTVMLRVSYEEVESQSEKEVPVVRTKGSSDLPKLDKLREEATDLGLDISHLGRQRRAIYDLIQQTKAGVSSGVDEVTVSPAKDQRKPPRKASIKRTKGRHKGPENGTPETPTMEETPIVLGDAGEMSLDDLLGAE